MERREPPEPKVRKRLKGRDKLDCLYFLKMIRVREDKQDRAGTEIERPTTMGCQTVPALTRLKKEEKKKTVKRQQQGLLQKKK